ncbi:biliverdin-producing heme oxygenase [Ochrobactrum haematophilum]|uniref:Biliverdin-producing heme oxygenase n=1 Tax=Brucella haematophila TaxID=419474 RepID=A0ABX1DPM9_9HYPH|nr:biliverdin-producing heme oxygenase [Brucella haematophila]
MNQRTVLQRRWDLKAATAPYHERIDRLGSLYGMFNSLDAYRKYLEATWHSRLALETLLDVSDLRRVFSDWDNHKIQSELQMDYADLSDGEELKKPELQFVAATPVDLPSAIGTLYVLEGSALGQHCSSRRRDCLVLMPGTVRDTWQSRSETWPVGRRLFLCLKPCRSTKNDEERCIEAAIDSFRTFEINYEKAFGEP